MGPGGSSKSSPQVLVPQILGSSLSSRFDKLLLVLLFKLEPDWNQLIETAFQHSGLLKKSREPRDSSVHNVIK